MEKYWRDNLYHRDYVNRKENNIIKIPSEAEFNEIYQRMRKFSQAEMYDCNTCGYGSCRGMAIAIFNGLNKVENCHHYDLAVMEDEHKKIAAMNQQLKEHISAALEDIKTINADVDDVNTDVAKDEKQVQRSSSAVEEIMATINNLSISYADKAASLDVLVKNAETGQQDMSATLKAVEEISKDVDNISSMAKVITAIAANTNLLSMNASIESAHAGDAGRGFAVVADEIRKLSDSTHSNSRNIAGAVKTISDGIVSMASHSNDTQKVMTSMVEEIQNTAQTMKDLINSLATLEKSMRELAALG
jgi:methyl-accepting chemotaxis protein